MGEQFKRLLELVYANINNLIESLVVGGGLLKRRDHIKDKNNAPNSSERKENGLESSTIDATGKIWHCLYYYDNWCYHTP